MKKSRQKATQNTSPEQVTPDEALRRMKNFVDERKEKFVAAIKTGKTRDISASKK
jgi:hypothetical protein